MKGGKGGAATVIAVVISVLQFSVALAAVALEYLSDVKMGVMRHLVFQRRVFEAGLFAPRWMGWYGLFFACATVGLVFMLIRSATKRRDPRATACLSGALALAVAGAGLVFATGAKHLMAYHFFLVAVFIALALQGLRLLVIFTPVAGRTGRAR